MKHIDYYEYGLINQFNLIKATKNIKIMSLV